MDFIFSLFFYGIADFFAKLERKAQAQMNAAQSPKSANSDVLNYVIMEDLEYEARLRTQSNKAFKHGHHTESSNIADEF